MLLNYLNLDFEDKIYNCENKWLEEKNNLGLDFPNLPYLMDGDFKITSNWAIYNYLALKGNRPDLLGVSI
jgi:glutathione S-transferase